MNECTFVIKKNNELELINYSKDSNLLDKSVLDKMFGKYSKDELYNLLKSSIKKQDEKIYNVTLKDTKMTSDNDNITFSYMMNGKGEAFDKNETFNLNVIFSKTLANGIEKTFFNALYYVHSKGKKQIEKQPATVVHNLHEKTIIFFKKNKIKLYKTGLILVASAAIGSVIYSNKDDIKNIDKTVIENSNEQENRYQSYIDRVNENIDGNERSEYLINNPDIIEKANQDYEDRTKSR